MNDEYHERGLFKQLVLIAWCAFIWIGDKTWRNETFCWVASVVFFIVALLCLKCAVVK
jgi:hypothetical protein